MLLSSSFLYLSVRLTSFEMVKYMSSDIKYALWLNEVPLNLKVATSLVEALFSTRTTTFPISWLPSIRLSTEVQFLDPTTDPNSNSAC